MRPLLKGLSLLLSVSLLAACGSQSTPKSEPAKNAPAAPSAPAAPAGPKTKEIRVGFNPTWTIPGLLVGKERDALASPDNQLKWVTFQTPNQVMEALAAGELDMGALTPQNYLVGLEKGLKLTLVANMFGWSSPTSSYMVRVDSGINSIKDLKGKTIGINNYGGNFDLYLRTTLEANGLDPKKDVKVIEIPIPNMYQALSTKQIDMGAVPPLFVPVAEAAFKGQFKKLFDYKDVPGVRAIPQISQLALVVRNDYLKDNRATVKAFLKKYLEAEQWNYANEAKAVDLWAQASKIAAVKNMTDPFGPDNSAKMDLKGLALEAQLMHKYGYLKKNDVDPKAIVDHTLIEEILAGK